MAQKNGFGDAEMKRKTIYKSLVAVVVLLFVLMFVLVMQFRDDRMMIGGYVFGNAIDNIDEVRHVSMGNENGRINLDYDGGLWRVREADGYYANYLILSYLFNDVYNSKYHNKMGNLPEDVFFDAVDLKLASGKEKVFDDILIGKKDDVGLYTFVVKDNAQFAISGRFVLPVDVFSWLQQPTFSLGDDDIMSIVVVKNSEAKNVNVRSIPFIFKDYLKFMHFEDVRKAQNVDEENAYGHKNFRIETYDGLVIELVIFIMDDAYWATLSLSTSKMPKQKVEDYVRENIFLYDGWYFKVPQSYGDVMYNGL